MISFVVLHYQALEETQDCVSAIFEKIKENKKIIIVDNHSPNGSGQKLKTAYADHPDVEVILMEENLGFAKGNNIGFKAAKKDNPQYIVVMNNDLFMQDSDFVDKLDYAFNKWKFDILGPDIFSTRDNVHQNPQRLYNYSLEELEKAKKRLELKKLFKYLLKIKYMVPLIKKTKTAKEKYVDHPLENVVLHGACYIFSKKYIDNHNNCFYNDTFMYYESYILHYLGQRENLKLLYYPEIKVLHHEDVATNQTYKSIYSKTLFVNRCLLDSCNKFIKIMKDEKIKIG